MHMEKLAKLGWQKLIIIAAALDIVLGIIFGAIFKAVPAGIIVGLPQRRHQAQIQSLP